LRNLGSSPSNNKRKNAKKTKNTDLEDDKKKAFALPQAPKETIDERELFLRLRKGMEAVKRKREEAENRAAAERQKEKLKNIA